MKTLGKSTRQLVKGLTADMKGKDFSEELGFMHEVKQEVSIVWVVCLLGTMLRVFLIQLLE